MHDYEVEFYKDATGKSDVLDAIKEIAIDAENSKESRILFAKITDLIHHLEYFGLSNNGDKIKKIKNADIWELRPKSRRILFFCIDKGKFVLLSMFNKKTQKTPSQEIEKAKRRMKEYLE